MSSQNIFEIKINGEYQEIEMPTIPQHCSDTGESWLDLDWDAIESQYGPDAVAEIEKELEYSCATADSDHATMRAESGYAQ